MSKKADVDSILSQRIRVEICWVPRAIAFSRHLTERKSDAAVFTPLDTDTNDSLLRLFFFFFFLPGGIRAHTLKPLKSLHANTADKMKSFSPNKHFLVSRVVASGLHVKQQDRNEPDCWIAALSHRAVVG